MAEKQPQPTGTGNIVGGSAAAAFGAANAPVIRHGSKDPSKMVGASRKVQPGRYQAELHQAMKSGEVDSGSTVHVLRTPSGRHINAGGTHRHIARQAMGEPSKYEIKDISHEMHVSPIQEVAARVQVSRLNRASRKVAAGKSVKPVSERVRPINSVMAGAADHADSALWEHPSGMASPLKAARHAGIKNAAIWGGVGALGVGVGLKQKHDYKAKQAAVVKRLMSDAEIKHRKSIQAHVSETTGALGLAGLGAFTAGRLGGTGKVAVKAQKVIPKLKKIDPAKADKVALGASVAGGGIGGAGAFNFASYTGAESKKRNTVVKKNVSPFEDGFYGVEAFAKSYDPEENRMKRAKGYEAGSLVAAGAGAGLAAHHGAKAVKAGKKMVPRTMREVASGKNGGKNLLRGGPVNAIPLGGANASAWKGLKHHGKAGAAAGVVAGGAVYANRKIHQKQQGSWSPYVSKSAFGVEHD